MKWSAIENTAGNSLGTSKSTCECNRPSVERCKDQESAGRGVWSSGAEHVDDPWTNTQPQWRVTSGFYTVGQKQRARTAVWVNQTDFRSALQLAITCHMTKILTSIDSQSRFTWPN